MRSSCWFYATPPLPGSSFDKPRNVFFSDSSRNINRKIRRVFRKIEISSTILCLPTSLSGIYLCICP
uniref:Uncharacterized protein n=1 Tax=Arundo donax TaxID=35708 RepID=A0A0A9G0H2_ARUDO